MQHVPQIVQQAVAVLNNLELIYNQANGQLILYYNQQHISQAAYQVSHFHHAVFIT